MTQDALYFEALFPAQAISLGLPLEPFSIGHYAILHREKSPFVTGAFVDYEDLFKAVWICADRATRQQRLTWLKQWAWLRRAEKMNWEKELAAFRVYFTAGTKEPLVRPLGNGRIPGTPWLMRLKNFLVQQRSKTESDALDFPYALAVWEYLSYCEGEGGCEIRNREEIDFLEYCKEQDRLAAEKKEAQCPA